MSLKKVISEIKTSKYMNTRKNEKKFKDIFAIENHSKYIFFVTKNRIC